MGNKVLFEDLWIYDKWDWSKTNPVIHISFDDIDYDADGLEIAISDELKECAENYNIELKKTHYKAQFKELLKALSTQYGKVVLLIDEYDKPIIDYLEKDGMETALKNQKIMRQFYSVLKNADDWMELIFITGVSKFSKVSLFSDLNNPSRGGRRASCRRRSRQAGGICFRPMRTRYSRRTRRRCGLI